MIAAMTMAQPVNGGVTPTKSVAGTKCPGLLRANQHAVGGERTQWTGALEDKDKHPFPVMGTMGVHVVFQGTETRARSLEFSVSYLPAGLRKMKVDPGADGTSPQTMKKTYALTGGNKARVEGDLLVGPASTVTCVHLVSATFADGSAWHATSESECSVEPNHVMAVDGKESSIEW